MNEAWRPMRLKADHDGTGDLSDPHEREKLRREHTVCRRAIETLQAKYPGHMWEVTCDLYTMNRGEKKPGAVMIGLAVVMPPTKKYVIPISNFMGDFNRAEAAITRAGGELLERYNMPRAGIDFQSLMAARPLRHLTYKDVVPT